MEILGYLRNHDLTKLDGPQYYRVYLPLSTVGKHAPDIDVEITGADTSDHPDADPWWKRDLFVMARIYNEELCPAYLEVMHNLGGQLVLDSDDDLTETYKLVSRHGEEFKAVLGMVDHVTVSTQPLADLFAEYTLRPPTVLKNCVSVDWLCQTAEKAKRLTSELTMGFSGSPTHWGDWRVAAVPFARILREHSVRGVLQGETPRYLNYAADNLIKFEGVPFSAYPAILKQLDIILCAVDSTDGFNLGKSGVKALESMALGVVPICSRFGPYLEMQAAGAPLVVVEEDSPDGWFEAMRKLVTDEDYRSELSALGPHWVRLHRDISTGWTQWADFYRSIV